MKKMTKIDIDCTCLDLFEEHNKSYYFNDCAILKKCIKNGILKKCDSVCIYGKENCGKTLLLTEILADLTAVKELKGMNCKVVYLDCDLSFNYKNYENIINKKFDKYIIKNNKNNNICTYNDLKKVYGDNSFSNIYYIQILNPGHLIVVLNTLKILLEGKNIFIEALFIDSLSFWNFCKYDKINFFSDNNYVKRKTSDLLDYAFTLILNLKKTFRFLFFYTKLSIEDKFMEYTINLSINEETKKQIQDNNENIDNTDHYNFVNNNLNSLKQIFLIPQNFNDILKTHIFRKKDFLTNNFLIEKPFLIFLIPNEKNEFTHINKKNDINSINFLLCLSSEMKNISRTHYSKFFFMIQNANTIIPL